MKTIKSLLNDMKYKSELGEINYGFDILNDKLKLLNLSTIITIFGTVAKGKTSFALNLALNAAKNGTSVLYLSNREKQNTLAKRLLAIESDVSCKKIYTLSFNEEELDKVNNAKSRLNNLSIFIKETALFNDEISELDECLSEFLKTNQHKLIIYDQYDGNKNVLLFFKRWMKFYDFTLIFVDSVSGNPNVANNELYSKVNTTLELVSDCVIGIHKKIFVEDFKINNELYANIYKLRNGTLSLIKYQLDSYTFKLHEVGIVDYDEWINCDENSLLI